MPPEPLSPASRNLPFPMFYLGCSGCNRKDVPLSTCSGCQTASYCNATCQKAHWSVHKRLCRHNSAKHATLQRLDPIGFAILKEVRRWGSYITIPCRIAFIHALDLHLDIHKGKNYFLLVNFQQESTRQLPTFDKVSILPIEELGYEDRQLHNSITPPKDAYYATFCIEYRSKQVTEYFAVSARTVESSPPDVNWRERLEQRCNSMFRRLEEIFYD